LKGQAKMHFVKFSLDRDFGNYSYQESSNIAMNVLGTFLSEVECEEQKRPSFKDWALADKDDSNGIVTHTIGTNANFLEEDDNGNIHIVDAIGSDDQDEYYIPGRIIVTRQQFVQLLDDWEENVCKHKPKEVIIKYDNDQFIVETKE
jgi:hypothetical protein